MRNLELRGSYSSENIKGAVNLTIPKIETIKTNEIIPYENNPRNNDAAVDAVANSISNFGFKVPIIIDHDNVIVAGHTRHKAAQKLGLEEVPCIRADDLTDEQIRAFRVADNKTAELADWDLEKLNEELMALPDIDMSQFGFDMSKFEDEPEIEEDEVPELPAEPKTKLGDIYQLGDHRLMCGDATSKDQVEKLVNNSAINLVLTDPPYGINIVNDNGKVGARNLAKNRTYSKVIADDTTDTAKASYSVLKTICDKLIIWGGNYFIDFLEFSDGWIIWDKRCGMNSNNFADGEMAYCSFHTPVRIYRQLWNGMIREGEHENRVHPTQKPIRMLGEIISDFATENGVVLDVFGGSGSTLIACEQLGRKCFMMELDPKYCDVIIERWEKLTGKTAELIQ